MPPIAIFVSEMSGRWFLGFWLCSLPLLALSPLLGVNPLPASGVAGGWFGEHYGWRPVFLLRGIFGIVYAALLFGVLRGSGAERERFPQWYGD